MTGALCDRAWRAIVATQATRTRSERRRDGARQGLKNVNTDTWTIGVEINAQ